MLAPDSGGGGATPVQAEQMVAARVAAINTESVQIKASAQQLSTSAGSGFHIEPQAAATLIKSCMDSLNELQGLRNYVEAVRQAPKLGQTPGAGVVGPFTQNVATDSSGIMYAIQNLHDTIQSMMQAYQKASTNYQETEAIIKASLPKT